MMRVVFRMRAGPGFELESAHTAAGRRRSASAVHEPPVEETLRVVRRLPQPYVNPPDSLIKGATFLVTNKKGVQLQHSTLPADATQCL